jgi:N-acetylglucosamine repressor
LTTSGFKLMQELNRYSVLNTIRKSGPISRIEIAKSLRLSPTTVASAVQELIKDELVHEIGSGASSGGRKPVLLEFLPDRKFLFSVSVSNTMIAIAKMTLKAVPIRKQQYKIPENEYLPQFIMDSLTNFMGEKDDLSKCLGISIITPGIVDKDRGMLRYLRKYKLNDIPLKEMMEERFNLRTFIENDVNAMVLAEKDFGGSSDVNNMIFINIGDGVGSGILVNSSIFRGAHGGAGEFGHMSIDRGGIRCGCGNTGCLGNYISWPALYSRIHSAIAFGRPTSIIELAGGDPANIEPSILIKAANYGDAFAIDLMDEVASYLSSGLINLVHMFNPERIILGGEVMLDNPLLLKKTQEYVTGHTLPILGENLSIHPSMLRENQGLIGAAAVLLDEVFQFPINSELQGVN